MGVVVGPHYSDNAVATDTVMAPVVVSSYLLLNSCVDCWHASQSTGLSLCTILDLSCRADIHTLVLCHLIKYFVTCLLLSLACFLSQDFAVKGSTVMATDE